MAEIEPAVLSTQSLDRRIPVAESLRTETIAGNVERNERGVTVNRHVTAETARHKLERLYPGYAL